MAIRYSPNGLGYRWYDEETGCAGTVRERHVRHGFRHARAWIATLDGHTAEYCAGGLWAEPGKAEEDRTRKGAVGKIVAHHREAACAE